MKFEIPPVLVSGTEEEIKSHFNDLYGFKDNLGHPIKNCLDFLVILKVYMQYRSRQDEPATNSNRLGGEV